MEKLLLSALVDFCYLVLRGDTPEEVRPFFFGASLVALRKKRDGVRPIMVGCTLRHLVQVACNMVVTDMALPRQLGYGVRGGSEAAIHAAHYFLTNMGTDQAVVKLDFTNAVNSIRRDQMLKEVKFLCPAIYPFVYSVHANPSNLQWGDRSLSSTDGVQQGDPLGLLLLFCLTLYQHCKQLRSEFNALYLDDVTLGGDCQDLLHDLKVMRDADMLGLTLNAAKCEIISQNMTTCGILLCSLPGSTDGPFPCAAVGVSLR